MISRVQYEVTPLSYKFVFIIIFIILFIYYVNAWRNLSMKQWGWWLIVAGIVLPYKKAKIIIIYLCVWVCWLPATQCIITTGMCEQIKHINNNIIIIIMMMLDEGSIHPVGRSNTDKIKGFYDKKLQ